MGGVGSLDVGILRALFQGQGLAPVNARMRTSLRAVANELGVSEGTVRNRVLRLHESGFIKEARLIPNPSLLGLAEANVLVDLPPDASLDEVVAELRLLEGTVILAVFHGRLISSVFRFRGERALAQRIELIRRLAGVEEAIVGRIPFPPCDLHLSSSDWALLRAFHCDPWKTYASVARDVRMSSRTVKRRLDRILGGCAAFVFPDFDVGRFPGGTLGTLIVKYPIERKEDIDRQVLARCGAHIFTVFHMLPFRSSDPAPCAYNIIVPNVPRGHELLRTIREIPGVQSARVEWFEHVEVNYEPFAEDLDRGKDETSLIRGVSGSTA